MISAAAAAAADDDDDDAVFPDSQTASLNITSLP